MEENIAFDNDFEELKNLGKENMARSHTKHMTEMQVLTSVLLQQLNFTVLPNFLFFLLSFAWTVVALASVQESISSCKRKLDSSARAHPCCLSNENSELFLP